jgi:hypothetical protein
MSTELARSGKFPLSFTAASLRPELARIIAQVYLDCGDWEATRQQVLTRNLLQSRARSSAIRMERELRQRLQTLTARQLDILAHATHDARRAIAWLAVLKHSPFVFAFAAGVLRVKYEQLDAVLRPSDYERFFEAQALQHPELARLKASTQGKIRRVIITMLREAGIIAPEGGELAFSRPLPPPDALDAIAADDPRWLAGFLVPDAEIISLAR